MKIIALLLTALYFSVQSDTLLSDLQQKGRTEKKYIAVYFSGSDWCSVCFKFKNETLNLPEIDSLLKTGFIYYNADFPQRKKLDTSTIEANEFLAEKLNPAGAFPLLIITDADWKTKAVIKRGNPSKEVITELKKLMAACQQ